MWPPNCLPRERPAYLYIIFTTTNAADEWWASHGGFVIFLGFLSINFESAHKIPVQRFHTNSGPVATNDSIASFHILKRLENWTPLVILVGTWMPGSHLFQKLARSSVHIKLRYYGFWYIIFRYPTRLIRLVKIHWIISRYNGFRMRSLIQSDLVYRKSLCWYSLWSEDFSTALRTFARLNAQYLRNEINAVWSSWRYLWMRLNVS